MKKFIIFLSLNLILHSVSWSQGILRGKITEDNGEPLIGVTVVLKSNVSMGAVTDFDGNFSLKLPDQNPQGILISYIGYNKIEETIQAVNGEVITKNFLMTSSAKTTKEVEVTAKAVRAKEYYMEDLKKKSATTIDYVSSETMKKTGDNNVTAAVTRVSGVSTNGSFITVRGIGDRYVKTAINGAIIPTLDPFTNNIKLDLFPASLVDNVLITKTASPELPGDWAGAYISIETKEYPDELSVNAETSFGYNAQSTFKEVISSERSSTDWLGYDNGLREYNHADFVSTSITPTQYQEFVALGLGSYYNSLGVNQENWGDGTTRAETYFKLGLVQLGLLDPALINDAIAFSNAQTAYTNGNYKSQAFNSINANVPASAKAFSNNWNSIKRRAPLNFSQSFSIGNQTKIFGKEVGFLTGFRYGSSVVYDPEASANRASVTGDGNGNYTPSISSSSIQEISKETNGWSALLNLACKLNSNNSVSLMFMPNLNGVNNVRSSLDTRDAANFIVTKSQFYEQRKQFVYQFKSEHYLPLLKMKMEVNASYTKGKSSAPDFKNLQYYYDPISNSYQIGGIIGDGIHRYYRYLNENVFDSHFSTEFPLSQKPGLLRKVKFGGAYLKNDRQSNQYDYSVNTGVYLQNGDLNAFFDPSHFEIHSFTNVNGVNSSTIDSYYSESNSPANYTFGNSEIFAGFALIDYSILPRLRFTGGLRIEKAKIFTDVVRFDSLGLEINDPRRAYDNGLPVANPGNLNEVSYLPSANVIYKLKADEEAPMNLRVNFSQTVARPSIRELSDISVYDYEFRTFVFGNSDLKMVRINNYDLRLESFFKSSDNISMSLFYKDFKNHIELINTGGFTWQNVDKSRVVGIELEGKKKITKQLSFSANLTLVDSKTEFVRSRIEIDGGIKKYIPQDTISRAMFGQSPYSINCILNYTADSLGLSVTLSYNVQGPRLVIAADVKEVPDIYELPRQLFDLKITKKIGNHLIAGITVRDLLNTSIRRSYKYSEGYTLDYDNYKYGTNYILSLSYKL